MVISALIYLIETFHFEKHGHACGNFVDFSLSFNFERKKIFRILQKYKKKTLIKSVEFVAKKRGFDIFIWKKHHAENHLWVSNIRSDRWESGSRKRNMILVLRQIRNECQLWPPSSDEIPFTQTKILIKTHVLQQIMLCGSSYASTDFFLFHLTSTQFSLLLMCLRSFVFPREKKKMCSIGWSNPNDLFWLVLISWSKLKAKTTI